MIKSNYYKKAVSIAAVLTIGATLFAGCGKKVEQVQTSPANVNKNEEVKLAVITKQDLKEIKMDADLKKKLDTFFSNFSEANVKPFEKDKIDDSSLISFGVIHVIINNDKLIQYNGGNKNEGYIKAENIDTMTSKYFGKKVNQHKTVDRYTFENGSYKFAMASGEAYVFSQIDKLYDLENNNYKAEISIYNASSGFTGDSHGTINAWKASGEEVPTLSNKVTATIQKINENGKERYILLDYK